jgi:PAS domain S-box-containing protein
MTGKNANTDNFTQGDRQVPGGLEVDCAITMLDIDGKIRGWTVSAERLTGWTKAIVGSSHRIFYTPDQRENSVPEAAITIAQSGEHCDRITCMRRDGSTFAAEFTYTALHDAEGTLRGFAQYIRDMTRSEHLDAVRAQNERAAVLGQLAGGMAHDFNNILQVITGSASMIDEHPSNIALVRRCAGRMIKAADRGSAISGRLLGFARRGNGANGHREGLNIKGLFDSIQELLGPLLPVNINVSTMAEADLPLILADQAQLETVLVNLATNARDAMTKGGDLVFSANLIRVDDNKLGLASGNYVRVTVTDNGCGMDAATISRVMEPFFTTKPRGRGTGLGLPLARDFAHQSGGALEISSEPHVSTQVGLWLPVAVSIKDAPKQDSPIAIMQIAARVLVVEDDDLVRETMAASLEQAGFTPIEVSDGESALTVLDDPVSAINALVVDYALPGMTGAMVIREAQRCQNVLPALLVTGHIGEMLVDGAPPKFSMLRKPFTPLQLTTAVGLLLTES